MHLHLPIFEFGTARYPNPKKPAGVDAFDRSSMMFSVEIRSEGTLEAAPNPELTAASSSDIFRRRITGARQGLEHTLRTPNTFIRPSKCFKLSSSQVALSGLRATSSPSNVPSSIARLLSLQAPPTGHLIDADVRAYGCSTSLKVEWKYWSPVSTCALSLTDIFCPYAYRKDEELGLCRFSNFAVTSGQHIDGRFHNSTSADHLFGPPSPPHLPDILTIANAILHFKRSTLTDLSAVYADALAAASRSNQAYIRSCGKTTMYLLTGHQGRA
ncbi:uncharacterized protein EDB93DRAFT_1339667 [Suillus bovinus]|uniref:uncharacterized protein n=1 Tax=Suillus bovinus TaxID=48563 RepID=UPI001B86BD3F|nr:uncharacterized protein EDB93DRAFT_1339667 [Suillus bovinus]KAG2135203.1 hypothetical protein EDB93DRAFT_1339667 [Suillus bovinus]